MVLIFFFNIKGRRTDKHLADEIRPFFVEIIMSYTLNTRHRLIRIQSSRTKFQLLIVGGISFVPLLIFLTDCITTQYYWYIFLLVRIIILDRVYSLGRTDKTARSLDVVGPSGTSVMWNFVLITATIIITTTQMRAANNLSFSGNDRGK